MLFINGFIYEYSNPHEVHALLVPVYTGPNRNLLEVNRTVIPTRYV